MNVFYEEEGTLKVGAVLADNVATLQVEAPHGKRSKIKNANVLLRFENPALAEFLPLAERVAEELDADFVWQCSEGEEFGFDGLAREYFGRAPSAVEAAGMLLKLHGAPMYFYKRGKGRYKAAPEDALKAALASVERKKQQALRKEAYVTQLTAGELPEAFVPLKDALLYKPDRNTIEWKALEEVSTALRIPPVRVIERCGGVPSTYDYHLNRFLFEHFPRSTEYSTVSVDLPETRELPLAEGAAFSIDDASTTEIDDAFSVTTLDDGCVRVGIHIAAPALAAAPGSALDTAARERLSTVYFPGGKLTMMPAAAIERYTLAAQREVPVLSLYTVIGVGHEVVSTETRLERIRIVENLRHDVLEPLFNERTADAPIDHALGSDLAKLWRWARALERARRGDAPEAEQRPEYSFTVENDRIAIVRRSRGTPMDKLVSELMIYANSTWARRLSETGTAAIYRVQTGGKVRMSTVPAPHVGLGVQQYAWASSPLRRYVDLINQIQLIALTLGEQPSYGPGDERLLAIMREFESAHEAYSEFQRTMERYWCLRWLLQEHVDVVAATVLRENLCRFDALPLVARVASLTAAPAGTRVLLRVTDIDLFELTFHCELQADDHAEAAPEPARLSDEVAHDVGAPTS